MALVDPYRDEGNAALTGAATGAMAGAAAGPYGALVGGIIGAGMGIFQAGQQNDAIRKAKSERRRRISMAQARQHRRTQQAESLSAQIRQPQQRSERSTPPATGMIGENMSSIPSSSGTF